MKARTLFKIGLWSFCLFLSIPMGTNALEVPLINSDIKIDGRKASDGAGKKVAHLGDVNRDGFEDFAIAGDEVVGIFFGKPRNAWKAFVTLNEADVLLEGEAPGEGFGSHITGGGDVNGDGADDIAIGAPKSSPGGKDESGKVYLVFGRANGWKSGKVTGLADASFLGEAAGDLAGSSASLSGDFNGDKISDLAIGSPGHNVVHLIYGKNGGWAHNTTLGKSDQQYQHSGTIQDIVTQKNGTVVNFGKSVSFVGDLDQNGFDDLAVGSPTNVVTETEYVRPCAKCDPVPRIITVAKWGQVYVFGGNGKGSFAPDLALRTPYSNQADNPKTFYPDIGQEVSEIGDVDGDGFPDCLTAAHEGLTGSPAHYVRGGPDISKLQIEPLPYYFIRFGYTGDPVRSTLAGRGDFNGDKIPDVLIGDSETTYQNTQNGCCFEREGGAVLMYGKRGAFPSRYYDVTFKAEQIANGDAVGSSVALADVDGDKISDALIGAPGHDAAANDDGRVYIVFGKKKVKKFYIEHRCPKGIPGCKKLKIKPKAKGNQKKVAPGVGGEILDASLDGVSEDFSETQ